MLHAQDGTPYLVKGRAVKAQNVRAWEEENDKGKAVSVRVTRESAETGVTLLNLQTSKWVDARPGNKERSLGWFVEEFGASLTRAILDTCPPVTRPRCIRSTVRSSSASRASPWAGRPMPWPELLSRWSVATAAPSSPQKVLALTGTLYGGVASSLFHLLYRLDPQSREEFAYSDLARWIETYGLYEITEKETEQDGEEIVRVTRRKTNRTTTRREIPGLMPQLIARLARHTVFLRLADVAPDRPPYEEHVTSVAMLPAQQRAYDRLKGDLLAALKEALVKGSKRLLGAYLQSILAYPDAPYREEVVVDPKDDHVVARAPALDEDMESETGREPATTGARTMTLFDYMAARPAAGASKGGKARTSPPSAQLLLFDLFAEQPGAAGAAAVPATPIQQRGIFADTAGAAEREEVA